MVATGRSKPVFTSPPGGSSSHEGCRAEGRVVSDPLGSRGGSGTFRRDAVAGIVNFERGRWKGESNNDSGGRSCFVFFRSCGPSVGEVWQRPLLYAGRPWGGVKVGEAPRGLPRYTAKFQAFFEGTSRTTRSPSTRSLAGGDIRQGT